MKKIILSATFLFLTNCSLLTGGKQNDVLPKAMMNEIDKAILENKRPVAAFDWDNTMIKNDIGDAVFFWMLTHDLFKAPANWPKTSLFLTQDAVKELNLFCPLKKIKKGSALKTSEGDCGKSLIAIYTEGKLKNGAPAWNLEHAKYVKEFIEPAYAWAASLMQGHTPQGMIKIAEDTASHALSQDVGAKQKIFDKEYTDFIRIYTPMKNLIQTLKEKGVEVWIVSASQQNIVEVMAKKVGVDDKHVIGIRNNLVRGLLSESFLPCGPIYSDNQEIITFKQGKRCWINKEIFKSLASENLSPAPLLFAAGDSDTDVEFLMDAKVKLVINRNKPELMCHAFANQGGKWFITPMFIDPKPKKTGAYACQKWGLPDQVE